MVGIVVLHRGIIGEFSRISGRSRGDGDTVVIP